mmetsp:Transcript_58938/g.140412  ORF Transcript_58938/g.140412 Transcript_58938/m.140412 type:complete len:260 (-) Transcript_58938:227-1006(-)
MPNLLAPLVHEVWDVLPGDLGRVDVENATCRGHVPGRGLSRTHVQDHVHVLQREGARRVQKLMVSIGSGEERVVLQKIYLRALLEVLRLALGEQMQAEVIVDPVAIAAGRRWPHVQVLVMPVRHDDLVGCGLIDLRSRNGVVGVRLQCAEHLAGEVPLHRVRVVVHQHSVLGLQHRLDLQEAGNGGIAIAHGHLGEVAEELRAHRGGIHVPASTDVGVGIEDGHISREDRGEVTQKILCLCAGVLHGHHQANVLDEVGI